jgi:hypothetical protein
MENHQNIRNMQKVTFYSKYQEIFESNPEWGKIEYRLQLSYANVSISLKKVYSICTPLHTQSTRSTKASS